LTLLSRAEVVLSALPYENEGVPFLFNKERSDYPIDISPLIIEDACFLDTTVTRSFIRLIFCFCLSY
jgi:hypothetical protein